MNILDKIIEHKRVEVAERKKLTSVQELEQQEGFKRSILSLGQFLLDDAKTGIIAEFKRKSPSKGIINDKVSVKDVTTAYAQAGALDKAERLFTDAAQFPGMLAEAYSNIGAITLRRGDAKQALWFLSRAAKRRPHRPVIRYNHALALHQLGRDAEAFEELQAAASAARWPMPCG